MGTVVHFPSGPDFRFADTRKRGDAIDLSFIISGQASLQPHDWAAVGRFRNGLLVVAFTTTATLATVDAANDSVRVTVTYTGTQANALRLGVYAVDIKDHTTDKVWASGTIEVVRSSVP